MFERMLVGVPNKVVRAVVESRRSHRRFRSTGAALAGVLLVLVTGCGGGGGGGSSAHAASFSRYCEQLKNAWPTLTEASAKATKVWADTQTPLAVQTQVAQELQPDAALYRHAAQLASSLAAAAPTSIKDSIDTLVENPHHRFQVVSTGFSEAAHDITKDLGNLDSTQFDTGTTGCKFGNNGAPDGTVTTLFTVS